MQVDRAILIKLLEAFLDASEVTARQLSLFQTLFNAACKAKGMNDEEIQKVIAKGRESLSPKIDEAHRANYLSLVDAIPQIVDLLEKNQDEALRYLREWTPKGLPN